MPSGQEDKPQMFFDVNSMHNRPAIFFTEKKRGEQSKTQNQMKFFMSQHSRPVGSRGGGLFAFVDSVDVLQTAHGNQADHWFYWGGQDGHGPGQGLYSCRIGKSQRIDRERY